MVLSERRLQTIPGHALFTRGTKQVRGVIGAIPPSGLVLLAIGSVQVGAAIAKNLFPLLGPSGTTFVRMGFAALILLVLQRPSLRGRSHADYLVVVSFGLVIAVMNLAFYSALDRLPLGIAVTVEFVGPLGVAIAGSRRLLDLLWAVLAMLGIALLTPWGGVNLNLLGVFLALLAGGFWAAYILLGARIGRTFSDGTGLTLGLIVATLALMPIGVVGAGHNLLNPGLLLVGAAVALLASVIPFSFEIQALRRLPTRVFSVLISTEPAIASIVGFVVLREALGLRALAAVVLVTIAAVGASRFNVPA